MDQIQSSNPRFPGIRYSRTELLTFLHAESYGFARYLMNQIRDHAKSTEEVDEARADFIRIGNECVAMARSDKTASNADVHFVEELKKWITVTED